MLINFSYFLKWSFNLSLFLAIIMDFDIVNTPCPGYKNLEEKVHHSGISESKYETYPEAKYD